MLPGKKYTPESVLQILRTRAWLLLVPCALVSAGTSVAVRRLPNLYRSEAVIQIVPQQVPTNYVRPAVTMTVSDRLFAIRQQILSRTRLEKLIEDFNLYPEQRQHALMEDLVERLRLDVNVAVARNDSFKVSYVGLDAQIVKNVTEQLVTLFIDESLKDRTMLAQGTNSFLESQLETTRARLMEKEKRLAEYRRNFAGQLPTQLQSNIQALGNLQGQIQTLLISLDRDLERRDFIEREIAELENQSSAVDTAVASVDPNASPTPARPASAAQLLAGAKASLAQMEMRLQPGHPDIRILKRQIEDLQRKADAEALQAPVSAGPVPQSPAEAIRLKRLATWRTDLAQLDKQIVWKQGEEKRLRGLVNEYQQRVELTPTRETEMIELSRDYNTLSGVYTSLLSKKEESQIATNLVQREIGESFRVIDPARVSERPFSPNRLRFVLMGALGGLAIGIGLLVLLEYRDASFKTDDEVAGMLSLPVLAVVPLMESDEDKRRAFRRKMILNLGFAGAVAGSLAVVAYTLVR